MPLIPALEAEAGGYSVVSLVYREFQDRQTGLATQKNKSCLEAMGEVPLKKATLEVLSKAGDLK